MRSIQESIMSFIRERNLRKYLSIPVGMIAIAMVFAVAWSLHLNGITLASGDLICGMEEHTHTDECYAWVVAETECTEAVDASEGTEAAELTNDSEELLEATENTETANNSTEESTSEEVAENGTESVMESAVEDATEELTENESTEETTESPQPGDTKVANGVTYVYALVCGMEEHTHTDECYASDESEEDAGATEAAAADEDTEEEVSTTAGVANVKSLGASNDSDGDEEEDESEDTEYGIATISEDESEDSSTLTATAVSSSSSVLDATTSSEGTYYVADAVKLSELDTTGETEYVIYTVIGSNYYVLDANGRLRRVNSIDSDGTAISWAVDDNLDYYQWNVTKNDTDTYTVNNTVYEQYLVPTYLPYTGTGDDLDISYSEAFTKHTGSVTLSGDFELTYTFTNTSQSATWTDNGATYTNEYRNWFNYVLEMYTTVTDNGNDDYDVYLDVRADNYGWMTAADGDDTLTFGNGASDWGAWLNTMTQGTTVTVNVVKSGADVTVTMTAADETFTATAYVAEFKDADITIYLTGQSCKIENVSYTYDYITDENSEVSSCASGSNSDLSDITTGFASYTDTLTLTGDFVLEYSFKNTSSSSYQVNYYNYILEMYNSDYVYLDVRADNYGWLANNNNSSIDTLTFGNGASDWSEWLSMMQSGASVTVRIERIGGYVTVTSTMTDGSSSYTFAASAYVSEYADGCSLYVHLTGEQCSLTNITYTYYTPVSMRTNSTSETLSIALADSSASDYAWNGTATLSSDLRSGTYTMEAQAGTGYIEWVNSTDNSDYLLCVESSTPSTEITFYFAKVRSYSVYFDGTNGGIYSSYSVPSWVTNPISTTVTSYAMNSTGDYFYVTVPNVYIYDLQEDYYGNTDAYGARYGYELNGWFDILNVKYYSATYGDVITFDYSTDRYSTTCYADWIAEDYNGGSSSDTNVISSVADTSTFVTTNVFDYNELFNLNSSYYDEDSKTWYFTYAGYTSNDVDVYNIFGKAGWGFIFFTNPSGRLRAPVNRDTNKITIDGREFTINGLNNYTASGGNSKSYGPTAGILSDSSVTSNLLKYLFDTSSSTEYGAYSSTNTDGVIGKTYLGTGNYLYQYDGTSGYYYFDSAVNAAFYNQDEQRFYLYDFLVRANVTGSTSDFLPFDYNYIKDISGLSKGDVYDITEANIDYYFGMSTTIDFYLPDSTSEYDATTNPNVNQTSNENGYSDMVFKFSGDDDVWVILDYGTSNEQLLLDLGGIHSQIYGEINFSTGTVKVVNNLTSDDEETTYVGYDSNNIICILDQSGVSSTTSINVSAGAHTLTIFYLERGASQSNACICFNISSSTYNLDLSKVDEDGNSLGTDAKFTFYDEDGNEALLSTNLRGTEDTSTFAANSIVYGLREGVTYTVKETTSPSGYTSAGKYFTVCLENTILTVTVYDSTGTKLEEYKYTLSVDYNDTQQKYVCTYTYSADEGSSSWQYVKGASLSVEATVEGGTVAYYDIGFTIVNTKEYELPTTGSMGTFPYQRTGLILIVVAGMGLIITAFYELVRARKIRTTKYKKESTEEKSWQRRGCARMRDHPRERSVVHSHARDRPKG